MRALRPFHLLVLCLLVWQTGIAGAAPAPRISLKTYYEDWDLGTGSLSETSTFLAATFHRGRATRLDLQVGHVSADLENGGDLSGLTNLRSRVSHRLNDRLAVRIGLSLPTGKTGHSGDEREVLRQLSDRLLGFRGYRLGEGMDFEFGTAYSAPAGPVTIGGGIGYHYKGEYELLEDDDQYSPGSQLLATLGFDMGNDIWTYRISYVRALYGTDKLSDVELFRVGPRNDLRGTVEYRAGRWTTHGSLQYIQHGNDKLRVVDGLIEENENSNRAEFYISSNTEFMLTRRVWLRATIGGRVFSESENGLASARRFDLGAGSRIRLSRTYWLQVGGRYSHAELDVSGEASQDLNGLMASLGIEVRL